MAVDIVARMLASQAGQSAQEIVDSFTSGFAFKGAVDYVGDLPASGNTNGDLYLVKYAGSSGTTPLNAQYAWGDDGGTDTWISLTPSRYVATFNATSDWTASGTVYNISVPQSTHNCGANAVAMVWAQNGSSYYTTVGAPTDGYTLTQNGDGDFTLTAEVRFAGKLVIS